MPEENEPKIDTSPDVDSKPKSPKPGDAKKDLGDDLKNPQIKPSKEE